MRTAVELVQVILSPLLSSSFSGQPEIWSSKFDHKLVADSSLQVLLIFSPVLFSFNTTWDLSHFTAAEFYWNLNYNNLFPQNHTKNLIIFSLTRVF